MNKWRINKVWVIQEWCYITCSIRKASIFFFFKKIICNYCRKLCWGRSLEFRAAQSEKLQVKQSLMSYSTWWITYKNLAQANSEWNLTAIWIVVREGWWGLKLLQWLSVCCSFTLPWIIESWDGSIPMLHFPHFPIFLPVWATHTPSRFGGGKPSFPNTTTCIAVYFHSMWLKHTHIHFTRAHVVSRIRSVSILLE